MAKWLLSRVVFCYFVLLLGACGHAPVDAEKPRDNLGIKYEDIDKTHSFGFLVGADKYYFAQVQVTHEGNRCWFFTGFKNDSLKYSFPSDRLPNMSEIYFKKLSVEEKKNFALTAIAKFEKEGRVCTAKIAERQATVAEKIETGVYFVFFLPMYIISAVTFAAEDTVLMIKDASLNKRMDQVRIGMTTAEIRSLLKAPLIKYRLPLYNYYFVDGRYVRLAMYFENDHLNAFVRGYKYKTQHEGDESLDK
jgi:hypothetical protein